MTARPRAVGPDVGPVLLGWGGLAAAGVVAGAPVLGAGQASAGGNGDPGGDAPGWGVRPVPRRVGGTGQVLRCGAPVTPGADGALAQSRHGRPGEGDPQPRGCRGQPLLGEPAVPGGGGAATGGSGGSGVVILSIPTAKYTGTTTGSPTVTTSGSNTILTYTASGTYTA